MSTITSPSTIRGDVDDNIDPVEERLADKKVLEEEDYLNRMGKIIRRDFFPGTELPSEPSTYRGVGDQSEQLYSVTPGTYRSQFSATNSTKSRYETSNLGLNEYLERYTSEDNAYFEKLQRKELKKHRAQYPWLYEDKSDHSKRIQEQLKLPSAKDQVLNTNSGDARRVIDRPYNSKNSLFYPPEEIELSRKRPSTVNYNSSRLAIEDIFKRPLPLRASAKSTTVNKFSDKIGIDGKLLNGSETPSMNNYSFIPQPETPSMIVDDSKMKPDTNRFYIPCESPRDELAHRVYLEKVAKNIRTPSRTGTPSSRTPSSRRGITDFSFSPERVKNLTPNLRHRR